MTAINAYILNDDGSIKYRRTGDVDSVLYALEIENATYTITPPPEPNTPYYWYDMEWHETPKP